MKISELARRSQVSKETIHYHIREGLLPKPKKLARNVADYDERYVGLEGSYEGNPEPRSLPLPMMIITISTSRRVTFPTHPYATDSRLPNA